MSSNSNQQIATQWFATFNAQDLEALLALYHDQAEHYSPKLKVRMPETNGMVRGKEALRKWWRDSFDRLPTLHYEVGEVLVIENGLIVRSRVYHG